MSWQEEIRDEGMALGQRKMFLNLLRQRFGEPTAAVAARIADATIDQLSAWTTRFFSSSSAEELVGLG